MYERLTFCPPPLCPLPITTSPGSHNSPDEVDLADSRQSPSGLPRPSPPLPKTAPPPETHRGENPGPHSAPPPLPSLLALPLSPPPAPCLTRPSTYPPPPHHLRIQPTPDAPKPSPTTPPPTKTPPVSPKPTPPLLPLPSSTLSQSHRLLGNPTDPSDQGRQVNTTHPSRPPGSARLSRTLIHRPGRSHRSHAGLPPNLYFLPPQCSTSTIPLPGPPPRATRPYPAPPALTASSSMLWPSSRPPRR